MKQRARESAASLAGDHRSPSEPAYRNLQSGCRGLKADSRRDQRLLFVILLSVSVIVGLLFPLFLTDLFGQERFLPDNPLRGRFVFEPKGCITCHAIHGDGGSVGPDLGQRRFYGSLLELAAIMWNHSPEMLRRMRELELPYPRFSNSEILELLAYLNYLRYLGEPGDLYRGKILLRDKGCLACHALGGRGREEGPAFDKLAKYISPLYLAQSLWNHGPEMDKRIKEKGLERPTFERGEIVDLSSYIRMASQNLGREPHFLFPGNPKRGAEVLKEKGCVRCHAVRGEGGDVGPDFSVVDLNHTVTEIAGLMWNHGSVMAKLMAEMKLQWPEFQGREMADLISFLYFLRFEDRPGDYEAGKELLAERGCQSCHGSFAPDVSQLKGGTLVSTVDMARIMWNHAPAMEEKVAERVITWPVLTGKEMVDLYTFLRKGRVNGKGKQ